MPRIWTSELKNPLKHLVGNANVRLRFVAIIGSFACVPLVYIYPPFLHYRGVADRPWTKALDLLLMTIGIVAMVYTTVINVWSFIA